MKAVIVIMLKAPIAGLVKTRLAKSIGQKAALISYKDLVEQLLKNLGNEHPIEIHYTPVGEFNIMKFWLGEDINYFPQCNGDLGDRLKFSVNSTFERGYDSVILLGGDCPYVTTKTINDTINILQSYDAAIGPSVDGGYYLLAIKQLHSTLFEDIDWSTEKVYSQTIAKIVELNLNIKKLGALDDVDNIDSLNRWNNTK